MTKWYIKNNNINFQKISKELDINPIIGKLMSNRGVNDSDSAKLFIDSDVEKMYPPEKMKDLVKAAEILKENIDNKNKIRIVGDYDVDGIMSTYILYTEISRLGGEIDYVIPDRIEDGYGINKKIVKKAFEDGIDTIITCDNGIASLEEVELAKKLGLTIIITDHHDLPFKEKHNKRVIIEPNADAVVNPKNPKCNYPFDKLCGAGVVYKLIEYLSTSLYNTNIKETRNMLQYVAIATICDVVDLIDENRVIVKEGMKQLNLTQNIGLKSLINNMEIEGHISVYNVGFMIGPALNASGRLKSAEKALELLLTEDEIKANLIGRDLKKLNDFRKQMTEDGFNNIKKEIKSKDMVKDKILVVYNEDIHESVAGIIAGRIKDEFYRPTIVLTESKGLVKGSARSIKEYNIFEGLTEQKHLLTKFGGHPMAAGLSLEFENIEYLREGLNSKSGLNKYDLIKKHYIDLGLPIDYINFNLIEDISLLEPYGKGNPKPIFGDKNLKIIGLNKIGKNKNVLKFNLISKKGTNMEGIMFKNVKKFEDKVIKKYSENLLYKLYEGIDSIEIDILYSPSINEFMGRVNIQLIIEDFRV